MTITNVCFQLLKKLSVLPSECSELVAGAIWLRTDEIRQHLADSSHRISHAYLRDFDWQIKVICLFCNYLRPSLH